jgi:RNA-directed DNA polymerase
VSKRQTGYLRDSIKRRLAECRLELQPEKTKIVYCKDANRPGSYLKEKFDFLGFTFRPRLSKSRKGKLYVSFSPAVSNEATKSIRQMLRSWRLPRRSDKSLEDFARMFDPMIRGWINYYGSYYKSALYPTLWHLDSLLSKWASRKYGRLRGRQREAQRWLRRVRHGRPWLFAHWRFAYGSAAR